MALTESLENPPVGDFCDFQSNATYEFVDGNLLVHINVMELTRTLTFKPQESMSSYKKDFDRFTLDVYRPDVLDEEGLTFGVPDGMEISSLLLVYSWGVALTLTAEFYMFGVDGEISGECTVRKKFRFTDVDSELLSMIDNMTGRTA